MNYVTMCCKDRIGCSYLHKLFVAQIFHLIHNIRKWKFGEQTMRPVFIALYQHLQI